MRSNGDTRDDTDAATESHIERMRQTYLMIERIDAEIRTLEASKRSCQKSICEALGVKLGEVADDGKRRVLATHVAADFYLGEIGKEGQALACVRVHGRRAAKSGFHATAHADITVFDDREHWFPVKTPYNPDGGAA